MQPKNIGIEKGWEKIRHYCAYQERSHQDTRDKLYSFGLYKYEVESLLTRLIEENYLNEERYATSFAGGHFRTKQWGRVKIKYALSQKKVSPYCIKIALAAINQAEYLTCLSKLAEAKLRTLKSEKNIFIKKAKLQQYLLQKGYEPSLVGDILKNM